MYGQIIPISELPKDVKFCGVTSDVTHFFTVMLFGTTYYIPIRHGSKTVIEKLGMSKIGDFVQDIIQTARLQMRDDIAAEIHRDLRQQISTSFEKMYGQPLFQAITDGMDKKMEEKMTLAEHKENSERLTDEEIVNLMTLKDEITIQLGSSKISNSRMNSLREKGFVNYTNYANGKFWELTDKGIKKIEELLKKE